jgi:hypothetical protein
LKSVVVVLCLPLMNLNPAKTCSLQRTFKILLLQLMTVESTENLQGVIFMEESMMTEVVWQVL